MPAPGTTSSKQRWFITTLVTLVIVAVVAGLALSRLRDADEGTPTGSGPTAARVDEIATT